MADKRQGIVAAGNALTAKAGAEVLADGGNAFDALIAALFVSFSSEPVLSSPGGGGFLLARVQGKRPELLDFFAQTPRRKRPAEDLDFFEITASFGTASQDFHIGLGSVATPGMVSGVFEIHERLGTRPLNVLAEQGVALAREGHEVDAFQAKILTVVEPIFMASESSRAVYSSSTDKTKVIQSGERLCLPELADFLEVLAIEGSDLFYKGEVAASIVAQQRDGGTLTEEDLTRFETRVRRPLESSIGPFQFATNPTPSSGGTLIAFALNLLMEMDLQNETPNSDAWVRKLIHVMEATNQARRESGFSADPHHEIAQRLLSTEFLKPLAEATTHRASKAGGTSHISITDPFGNVATCTLSNGEGCGHLIPGAGFMMNNMLGEEDLNPGGFFEWSPDTRISSMMSPSILSWPDGRQIALGSGGSNRIRTALTQVASHIGLFGLSPQEAVEAPRVHAEKGMLHAEAGFSEEVQMALKDIQPDIEFWPGQSFFFGGVHVAETGPHGARGAADARRGGVVEIV